MISIEFLLASILGASTALATACPKPTINIPSGPVNPFTITGTAYRPCDMIDILINGQNNGLGNAWGPSNAVGAPITFSYDIDTVEEFGEYEISVVSWDIMEEFTGTESDVVHFTYGY